MIDWDTENSSLLEELLVPRKMKRCQEQKQKHRCVHGFSVNNENLGHNEANSK